MDAVSPTLLTTAPGSTARTDSFSTLGSQDFLKLLITQLTTQDPLEPTGNQELLQQIASIRDIELSTTLTDSLRALTGDQRFGSAAGLIGQYVIGAPANDGTIIEGVVSSVRFEADGRPVLQLSNGSAVALEQIAEIHPASAAAQRLLGQRVVGVDRRQASMPVVEGVVTGGSVDETGAVVLELDSGNSVRLSDVVSVTADTVEG